MTSYIINLFLFFLSLFIFYLPSRIVRHRRRDGVSTVSSDEEDPPPITPEPVTPLVVTPLVATPLVAIAAGEPATPAAPVLKKKRKWRQASIADTTPDKSALLAGKQAQQDQTSTQFVDGLSHLISSSSDRLSEEDMLRLLYSYFTTKEPPSAKAFTFIYKQMVCKRETKEASGDMDYFKSFFHSETYSALAANDEEAYVKVLKEDKHGSSRMKQFIQMFGSLFFYNDST